uniref:PARP catalytic domain-containing protein n=1 Tax=Homalodisca liturata TaxID=320908 RepID=A0A1B6INE4_9HEMI
MMLGAVLNIVPDYWNDANYDSRRYHLFELNNEDDEYINEMEAFDRNRIRVTKLERIQNPFQFGRFQIRKEQKDFRNNIVEKIKCYHCISQGDLNIALEHNLDVRRYVSTQGDGFQLEKKNPKFYRNLSDAYNSITCSNKVILICDILGRGNVDTCVPTNDTEYMPKYVAYLS